MGGNYCDAESRSRVRTHRLVRQAAPLLPLASLLLPPTLKRGPARRPLGYTAEGRCEPQNQADDERAGDAADARGDRCHVNSRHHQVPVSLPALLGLQVSAVDAARAQHRQGKAAGKGNPHDGARAVRQQKRCEENKSGWRHGRGRRKQTTHFTRKPAYPHPRTAPCCTANNRRRTASLSSTIGRTSPPDQTPRAPNPRLLRTGRRGRQKEGLRSHHASASQAHPCRRAQRRRAREHTERALVIFFFPSLQVPHTIPFSKGGGWARMRRFVF
jgi:hypothetical protein